MTYLWYNIHWTTGAFSHHFINDIHCHCSSRGRGQMYLFFPLMIFYSFQQCNTICVVSHTRPIIINEFMERNLSSYCPRADMFDVNLGFHTMSVVQNLGFKCKILICAYSETCSETTMRRPYDQPPLHTIIPVKFYHGEPKT